MRQANEDEKDVLETLIRMGLAVSADNISELIGLLDRSAARKRAKELEVMGRSDTSNHDPVVYFVRNGNLVKIGTTVNLKKRMRKLSMSMSNVLRTEPGGQEAEFEFHRRFAAYRDGVREWFKLEGSLADFLGIKVDEFDRVLAEAGVDDSANPSEWPERPDPQPQNDLLNVVFGLVKAMTPNGGIAVQEIIDALSRQYDESDVPTRQTITRWLREDDRIHKPTGYKKYAVKPDEGE